MELVVVETSFQSDNGAFPSVRSIGLRHCLVRIASETNAAILIPESVNCRQQSMFGVLNLNKPPGVTSRDVVNVVQRIVKPIKVGHAGTLDPMATGVLLVCVGPATRLISLLQQAPKNYVAEFRLGERSDTDDSTGTVSVQEASASSVTMSQLETTLQSFVGSFDQVPPVFSAVKVQGQRAYAKARRGEDVQLLAKRVTVYAIDLLDFSWPVVSLRIRCGSGTYIRSIARDLGEKLGCGAFDECSTENRDWRLHHL